MLPYRSVTEEPPDLVAQAEAFAVLGVGRSRFGQLRLAYDDFPPPALTLKVGALWWRADLLLWDNTHERRPGRRRET